MIPPLWASAAAEEPRVFIVIRSGIQTAGRRNDPRTPPVSGGEYNIIWLGHRILPQIRRQPGLAKTSNAGPSPSCSVPRLARRHVIATRPPPSANLCRFWPACATIICGDLANGVHQRSWQFKPKCDPTPVKKLWGNRFATAGGVLYPEEYTGWAVAMKHITCCRTPWHPSRSPFLLPPR